MLRALFVLIAAHGLVCMTWVLFDPPEAVVRVQRHGLADVPVTACSCVHCVGAACNRSGRGSCSGSVMSGVLLWVACD